MPPANPASWPGPPFTRRLFRPADRGGWRQPAIRFIFMDHDRHSRIAIVSAAGLFPGADDLEQFWQNMVDGRSAISPVPAERWPVPPDSVYDTEGRPDKARSLNAGLVQDFAFRAEGFALSSGMLRALDPMHHLVLEAGRRAWQTCRNEKVDPQRVDIILAAIALPTEAASRMTRRVLLQAAESKLFHGPSAKLPDRLTEQELLASGVTAFPAALLGAALALGGDTLTLDAACASSLFAIKLACDALQAHRADAVLAGGVARPDTLYTQIGFTQLQALSRSGRCAPFDRSADGLVVGEGCGIVVLKRLSDALAQGDTIHGVISGLGLSNDMRGNLLAPDEEGQLRAMQAAYAAAGWDPRDVDLIECHGAATPVGDATELRSLRTLWGAEGWQAGQCAIGSVKSMIGHLLTAAGAAGLIKVLLGLRHGILPPSLNFEAAAARSPLHGGPFRVQTVAAPWLRRSETTPRRAAVSAFGFGGINAHLLMEEWLPATPADDAAVVSGLRESNREPIAVVGMDALLGPADGLPAFEEFLFQGRAAFEPPSERRWKNCRTWMKTYLAAKGPSAGAFLDDFQIDLAKMRIPPKEIPDILPQHLLMLKVAGRAMEDAALAPPRERPAMGCIVGMEFDLENTNFHLRWVVQGAVERWAAAYGLDLDDDRRRTWAAALADAFAPPLTHTRTLGSLGSLIASRMAREFRFGGPSFTVSDDTASGLKALALGVDLLRRREVDAMLVGAVDLPGELRRILRNAPSTPYTRRTGVKSLDRAADGSLPGEGAVAVVIKRLADARRDGDRIYALVRGRGLARGNDASSKGLVEALSRAFAGALDEAEAAPASIGYVETHGSGNPVEDQAEIQVFRELFASSPAPPALGALKASLGHAGAAAGLAGFVKTALTLHHRVLPALPYYQGPPQSDGTEPFCHVPRAPVYWPADRRDLPRRACVDTLTPQGGAMAVLLEEHRAETAHQADRLRNSPLGPPAHGLFLLRGDDTRQLATRLERLEAHLRGSRSAGKSVGKAALEWFRSRRALTGSHTMAVSLGAYPDFDGVREKARHALQTGTALTLDGLTGCHFAPQPSGAEHPPVLVYPGSGNHYLGMGRQLSAQWPAIWRTANRTTERFASQCRSHRIVPFRADWRPGWQRQALADIDADPLTAICGQVVFGCLITDLLRRLGIVPAAVIGYSLGETVGYFASGAWPDRGRMLERLEASDLFRSQLAGPCRAARRALSIPDQTPVAWRTAVINRSGGWVEERLADFPALRLLIVNTPEECVIGGHGPELETFIQSMDCEAVRLTGVVAVHCDAVQPVAEAYRDLHRFPTTPPPGIDYYSCAYGRRFDLTSESAADSLLQQALVGFDFPAVVEQAYADGRRLFLEVGPQASCTRMIGRILSDRPHLALSLSSDTAEETAGVARALAILAAEGQPVDLEAYFPAETAAAVTADAAATGPHARPMAIACGGRPLDPPRPPTAAPACEDVPTESRRPESAPTPGSRNSEAPASGPDVTDAGSRFVDRTRELMQELTAGAAATSAAHQSFLTLSEDLSRQYAAALDFQMQLVQQARREGLPLEGPASPAPPAPKASPGGPASDPGDGDTRAVAYDRAMCMEFAVGSAARVLGPEFAVVDSFPARVRLPDEPLMLVDRILSVDGPKGTLGPGRLVTEHDVHPDAWYLDGDRAPVCIAVEAGQADLFLCAYLGIDLEVKGRRTYRLLDAAVTFHRGLPRPGEVIRYAIEIEKFIRQGPTWLFFFRFEGTIDGQPLITMRNGCAGFFTEEEVRRSGGIILTEEDRRGRPGIAPEDWRPLVPMAAASYDDEALDALRRGDLEACFGDAFKGIRLPAALRLPGGRMALIDRVLSIDPAGGRYGLGRIRAEADIDPQAWFLTCHFVDDMVMPGTLMYECCAHTLRIYLQRMGWISDRPEVAYEPVLGRAAVLKCRGPVTPETRRVVYEVDIHEIGFGPEPYVTADAHMYADGQRIVFFRDMSMKMTGMDRGGLEAFWAARHPDGDGPDAPGPVFSSERLLEFAAGRPSRAFGAPYRPFDGDRFIARLPRPPYAFIHRVTRIDPQPWVLAPDGWVHAECDLDPQDWYFRSNGAAFLPIGILMEIALQPCGFLAAYMGSALKSERDLHFRNLDGEAVLHGDAHPEGGAVRTRARLLNVSAAGDMLIEHYEFEVRQDLRRIYSGQTTFGFFTAEALSQQAGLPAADRPTAVAPAPSAPAVVLGDTPPLTPDDPSGPPTGDSTMPSRALRMIDAIEVCDPEGGPAKRGYVRGSKTVDPQEWFFKAHFYQDPVCPGSLGVESLVQLLRYAAGEFWPEALPTHTMALLPGVPHGWRYRGQILPTHRRVEVEAVVTERRGRPYPRIVADGYLKCDGLYIYKMQHFGLELRPEEIARTVQGMD